MKLMRPFLVIFLTLVYVFSLAQNNEISFTPVYESSNWFRVDNAELSPKEFTQIPPETFGLDENSSLVIFQVMTDDLGMAHYRLRHEIDKVPVHASELILHEKDGVVHLANGRLVYGEFQKSNPSITADQAIQSALNFLDAESYLWQKPGMETLIKRIKKDPKATFYPQPKLVYADETYSQRAENYSLAWKMEIFAEEPVGTKEVFIDALSGEMMYSLEKCHKNSVPGQAQTRYHGLQEILTDSTSKGYRLRDYTRASGIETYDANNEFDANSATDFYDEDNLWDNANSRYNDAATDVHWGMASTYDYFKDELDWDSYDNEGSLIVSYVHVGSRWFNASWNGAFARFGDGNSNPLTSIDVVSHELTHGITGNSSRLIYRDESGAINESFSDIFGNVVERYALGQEADWLIGRENFVLRNMANPKEYDDPDTYRGDNWHTTSSNNGGVHTNSGVMNYWFYLLAEGGSGTNDRRQDYEVDGIGFFDAAEVAHRNNVFYLVPSSNYEDARIGALLSAADIYGPCSKEVEQVTKAWHAVGLGPSTLSPNLKLLKVNSPKSACAQNATSNLEVEFELLRSGCSFQLEPDDTINVGYRLKDEVLGFNQDFQLGNTLIEGNKQTFSVDLPSPLTQPGTYRMDVWVSLKNQSSLNDTLFNYRVSIPEAINDEAVVSFEPFNGNEVFYYDESGEKARVEYPQSLEAVDGFVFARMTGTEIRGPQDIDIPETPQDIFNKNSDFRSSLNFCLDIPNWEEGAFLEFELRQTWSRIYNQFGISNSNRLMGTRVLANNQVVGGPYYPSVHQDAEWQTVQIDLSDYINNSIALSIEGVHFISKSEDRSDNSDGDKTEIDLFRLKRGISSSTESSPHRSSALTIYPNPNQGEFTVSIPDGVFIHGLGIYDMTGRLVYDKSIKAASLSGLIDVKTSLTPGVYFVQLTGDETIFKERLILTQ